jgi:HK97 family phage major capsid protein
MSKATRKFVSPVLAELRSTIQEAETLTSKAELTKRDEARVSFLLAKISSLRTKDVADKSYSGQCKQWFRDFHNGVMEMRGTDLLAGTATPSYTQGSAGGFLVPQEFFHNVVLGMAQVDPLLDEDAVTVIPGGDSLRPIPVPGWDLSSYAAALVSEGSQQNPQTVPVTSGLNLKAYTFRATLDASFELEDDSFDTMLNQIQKAYSVAFARGIGSYLVTGTGSGQPQGVLTGATDSSVTIGSTGTPTISAADIEKIYFAVNRIYRASDKCAWVMNDQSYQLVRKAADTNSRPLLDVVDDEERLFGKPVLVSPTMPFSANAKGIVFGDLSHYIVRANSLRLRRSIQTPGYVEKGKALYTGLLRADAGVLDPTGGSTPPIVYATYHS